MGPKELRIMEIQMDKKIAHEMPAGYQIVVYMDLPEKLATPC